MTIKLKYVSDSRKEKYLEYKDTTSEIDLSKRAIRSIDLSSLSNCTNLVEINLSQNSLQSIDLSPLSNCKKLQELWLGNNDLKDVDLSPLRFCSNLQVLWLGLNKLHKIDLLPLSSCSALNALGLSGNRIRTINLSPIKACTDIRGIGLAHNELSVINLEQLSSCVRLKELYIEENNLQSIDLNPLQFCRNLQYLHLESNQISSVDLSPLGACMNLRRLSLHNNKLRRLDLSPLVFCNDLVELNLSNNQIESIVAIRYGQTKNLDLSNLDLQSISFSSQSSWSSLKELNLAKNKLESIDLSPLSSCIELERIDLSENEMMSIDVTPLPSSTQVLHDEQAIRKSSMLHSWLPKSGTVYGRPSLMGTWSFLHSVVDHQGSDRRVQHDILCALGLEDYGFIDKGLRERLRAIPNETAIEEVRNRVKRILVKEIAAAVDRGGPTTGLKLEELLEQHAEIATRAARIIELRKKELDTVRMRWEGDRLDLRELWLTAYGYQVLTTLEKQLTTDRWGFEYLRDVLSKLGFQLKTGGISTGSMNMSDEMKKCIWFIVEKKGRSWLEIEREDMNGEQKVL